MQAAPCHGELVPLPADDAARWRGALLLLPLRNHPRTIDSLISPSRRCPLALPGPSPLPGQILLPIPAVKAPAEQSHLGAKLLSTWRSLLSSDYNRNS